MRAIINKELWYEFFKSKLNQVMLLGSVSICTAIILLSQLKPNLRLFPSNPDFTVAFFNDSVLGNHSQILSHEVTDSAIQLHFQLRQTLLEPYVGFHVFPKHQPTINLKPYNSIEFEAEGHGINNILVYLIVQNTDSMLHLASHDIFLTYNLAITANSETYRVPLNLFSPPDWWYSSNRILPNQPFSVDLSRVRHLNFATGPTQITEDTLRFNVQSIRLVHANKRLFMVLGCIETGIILLLLFWHWYKNKNQKRRDELIITYKPVITESSGLGAEEFLQYISTHFHEAELTLEQVTEITGISSRRIANHILQTFGCNFKTYVNQIRITESKRLIKETDLNMGEIAYKVGFNSPNHFNRVFKSLVGVSPSEFKAAK